MIAARNCKGASAAQLGRSIAMWHIAASISCRLDDADTSREASLRKMGKRVWHHVMQLISSKCHQLLLARYL